MSDVDIAVAPPVRVADWEALAVPEGYRAEIIRGELVVAMAPQPNIMVVPRSVKGPAWRST